MSKEDLLVFRLFAVIAAGIYAGVPRPEDRVPAASLLSEQIREQMRDGFREARPDVDVSDDVSLGRAIEALAMEYRPAD